MFDPYPVESKGYACRYDVTISKISRAKKLSNFLDVRFY